jgi:O-antigen ligase
LDPAAGNGESSLGELFGRLADEGRGFVKAEGNLFKAIALRRADRAKYGLVALVVAAILAEAALIVLLVAIALALALYVGVFLGGLIVAAVALLAAWLLVRFGLQRVRALGGDEEEKEALAAGEKKA